MNELNFENILYKKISLKLQMNENIHSTEDAFFLLINKLSIEDLDNLCSLIHKEYFNNDNNISLEDCYKMTQDLELENASKQYILNLAYKCIENGEYLGNKTIMNGKINTSSWLSHALNASLLSKNLAKIFNINENNASSLALLHDYGRKYTHAFNHTLKGFEELVNIGWYNEAIGCLTHSFLKGGRCANNEPAIDGFYVDELGNPQFLPNTKKDDITLFLENYTYTDYDLILNITDLMTTDKGILPPHERIKDIATRREIDPTNRGYFLAEFTNTLIDIINKVNNTNLEYIKATKDIKLEEIETYFSKVSEIFYTAYLNLTKKKENNYSL